MSVDGPSDVKAVQLVPLLDVAVKTRNPLSSQRGEVSFIKLVPFRRGKSASDSVGDYLGNVVTPNKILEMAFEKQLIVPSAR
jgi:hypothetical protein